MLTRRPTVLAATVLAAVAIGLVPSSLRPHLLPCHRDLLDFFLPMKVHFARAVAEGYVPWWEEWTSGGVPFWANLQSQVAYPPNWLFLAVAAPWGLSLYQAGHLWWAGLGAHALARRNGLSPPACLLAATGFAAGGFVVSLGDLLNQLCGVAWLPWMALAGLVHAATGTRRSLAGWAATGVMAILAGAPQIAVLGAITSLGFALHGGAGRQPARRTALAAVLGGSLAVGCCALQLVPFAELVTLSDRASSSPVDPQARHGLDPGRLGAVLQAPRSPLDAPAGPYVRSFYLGPILLIAGLAGLAGRDRLRVGLAAATAGSLLLASAPHVPGLGAALQALTPFLRYPIKYASVAALTVPILAGLGLDRLQTLLRGRLASRTTRAATISAAVAWGLVLAGAADQVRANRTLSLALPAAELLAPTPVVELLKAGTRADGPRVLAAPTTRQRLLARSRRAAAGDTAGAQRERVELLEGGLPAVFQVHATWGGLALTPRAHAEIQERAERGELDAETLRRLQAGFLLVPAGTPIPLPLLPAEGGAAELHVIPGAGPFPERTFMGPNRAVGPAGLPAPSTYPGWTEGPPGTWSFEPRGARALTAVSLVCLALLVGLAAHRPATVPVGSRPRAEPPCA